MTTSQGTGKPAEQPAEAEAAPGTELSPRAAADGDAQETAPLTGRIAAAPDNQKQLEAEIERTREQLGETVQELVARVDVKSRARAKAAELTGAMKSTTLQARQNAAARAGSVRGQVADKTASARQKAMSASGTGKDQFRSRVAAVGGPVWEATPDQVRQAVTKGANGARERWMPIAVAAGVLIVGYLAIRRWNGRSVSTESDCQLPSGRAWPGPGGSPAGDPSALGDGYADAAAKP
jgi:hypothetical protein